MRKLFLFLTALITCALSINAQTRTYSGTVLDAENNEPLVGATIMPIGGGQGTAADLDGNFTLTVPANVTKAKVTYVGYNAETVDLKNNMKILLHSSSTSLDEMVVVAYGTANKESLTGSVAVVGAKEIEDRPVTTVTAALEGNAPGVRVNNSVGYPGSSPQVVIRGFNTINGSTAPLYVVDGVPLPIGSSIADLNPSDIESMSVLKDAASSALYGNRGANGVILITTKRAKNSGHVEVSFSIRQGMYNRGLPFYDRLGTNEYMQALFDGYVNGYLTSNSSKTRQQAIENYRSGNTFFNSIKNNVYGPMTAADLFDENGKFVEGNNPMPGYTDLDWWPAISRHGYRQEYDINMAAATDKFSVFTSVGYLKEQGYMLQTDYERFAGRINADYNPVSFFKTGLNMSATYSEQTLGNITSKSEEGLQLNPFATMFLAPIYPYYKHDQETGEIIYENGSPVWNTASYLNNSNVAWTMRLNDKYNKSIVADATLYGTAIIPYGFELTVRGNIHRDKTTYTEYTTNKIGDAKGVGSFLSSVGSYNAYTFMQLLNWAHDYGDHHVDVLLDHENYKYTEDVTQILANGQQFDDMHTLGNFTDVQSKDQSLAAVTTESYLGRVRYNYDQKYFGEASIRRDGSSYFAKNTRWGTFWSVGGSWIISKEKFLMGQNWINYLKLRAAYGSVGNNESAGPYSYFATMAPILLGNSITLVPNNFPSEDLKWEDTRTFDIGLEGSLFNDRFNFSIGYFNKRNVDLIMAVPQMMSAGSLDGPSVASILRNIGTMQNIGWELQFGVDIIRNRDFYWNFNVDATFLRNKIIKLPGNHDDPANNWFKGYSISEMAVPNCIGIDQLTGQALYQIDPDSPYLWQYDAEGTATYREGVLQGYFETASENGNLFLIDGKYYTTDPSCATSTRFGTSFPTVDGSFSTNLSWKGINLGLLFTYSIGGWVYDSNYQTLMSLGGSPLQAASTDLLKSWTEAPSWAKPHEETQVTINYPSGISDTYNAYIVDSGNIDKNGIPQINNTRVSFNNSSSSRFLTKADYLVLKNLNVSYDLPQKWVSAMKLQNINIGFSVDNLFTVTRRKGMNPQYSFGGGQGQFYVPARVFSFQLNVKI